MIVFGDGSRCDTSIRTKIVLTEGGYIEFDRPPKELVDTKATRTQSYSGFHTLHLDGVPFRCKIMTHDQREIVVMMSGEKSDIDSVGISTDEGTLRLQCDRTGVSAGGISISGISISNTTGKTSILSGVNIGGSDAKMEIKIPRGTMIQLTGEVDEVTIGDVETMMVVNVSGDSSIKAGSIAGLLAELSGNASFTCAMLTGNPVITATGHSQFRAKKCNIEELTCLVRDSGDVKLSGQARRTDVEAREHGTLRLRRSLTTPIKNTEGCGKIDIKRIG